MWRFWHRLTQASDIVTAFIGQNSRTQTEKHKSSPWSEGILCTYTLVRGFSLKDTSEMLKLQWMLLVRCQWDCQQIISPSVLAENRAHLAKDISEPPELQCCVAAGVHETCLARVLCSGSNLFNGRWKNKQMCCQCRCRMCVLGVRNLILPCTDVSNYMTNALKCRVKFNKKVKSMKVRDQQFQF